MIVSFNFYYAHPGQEDAVLRQRLRACDVRLRIGVPRGRVLARIAGAADLPDVIWEHHFDDVAGHHADMAVRAASAEFEAVRAGMRKLCRRFERPLFEVCTGAAWSPPATPDSGVVMLDWVFCKPEQTIAAADFNLDALQGAGGDRLMRLITPGSDLPELILQYPGVDAVDRLHRESAAGFALQALSAQARAVVQRLEHSVWTVN